MQLNKAILLPIGLRYVVDALPLQSGVARRMLLEREAYTDTFMLEEHYRMLRTYMEAIAPVEQDVARRNLQFRLQGLKDIRTTLEHLRARKTLDDIELFEVKHLAILFTEVEKQMQPLHLTPYDRDASAVDEVIRILDPDGLRIATFYIYDSYSADLRSLRQQLEKSPQDEHLFVAVQEQENIIRKQLADQLFPYATFLQKVLLSLIEVDILLAEAVQAKEWQLCLPQIAKNGEIRLSQMWHPEVKQALNERHREYQRNDICVGDVPTILTGSNMGGKTIVLKTVGLCQMLMLYGMAIPAKEAVLPLREHIYCCMADGQSVEEGLSSFAAEMQQLNVIIQAARQGQSMLALIDEPARTTNPVEGTALVSALIAVLKQTQCSALVVTHYTINAHHCPCLRVRGMENGTMNYCLEEAHEGEVPHEALRIAESLGIDDQWLQLAKEAV